MKNKELAQAEQDRHALIEMYQAGFYDGYNSNKIIPSKFNQKIRKKCIKAFELRFVKRLQNQINKVRRKKLK